jgi:integrase/recombinase XerD
MCVARQVNSRRKAVKVYVEPSEVILIEEAATNLRDRLLISLLFHLGCRVSEALSLEVDDIDFAHGTVKIQRLKTRTNLACPKCGARLGKTHTFCPKCGAKVAATTIKERQHLRMRVLPLDRHTSEMLQDFVKRGGPVNQNGKRLIFGMNRHRAWQIVTDCAERAGLPKLINPDTGKIHNVSPHQLRDAFAVHAVKLNDSGDGLRLLQEHLGHASFNTTAKYRKVAGEELRGWYDRLWSRDVDVNGSQT